MARSPNNLVALGSAAVLTIYGAGYQRTRAAADKFANEADAHARPTQHVSDAQLSGRGGGAPSGPTDRAPLPMESRTSDAGVPSGAGAGAPSKVSKAASGAPAASSAAGAGATIAADTATAASAVTTLTTPAASAPTAPVAPTPSAPSAPAATEATKSAPAPEPEKPRSAWHDGSYTGWGSSRHGDIEATVVVENGRIVSAQISRCLTRYSCSWIAHLQQQVVARQSPEVDFVSGATQSTNAFYYAVVEALKKAM